MLLGADVWSEATSRAMALRRSWTRASCAGTGDLRYRTVPVAYFRADTARGSLAPRGDLGIANGCSLDAVEALADRLPESRDRIRRRYWRDPVFRAVCDDHRDALEMLDRLEGTEPPTAAQAERYRELVSELFAEAVEMLAANDPP